jgi:CheY-like chemotaxis protein
MGQEMNTGSDKGGVPAQADNQREQNQALFRQYLRQADKCLIDRQFAEARQNLEEAKKLSPRNPFILAFEERISLFENKTGMNPAASAEDGEGASMAATEVETVAEPPAHDEIELRIRQELEAEYRMRFTAELRKAEEHAASLLNEERAKLEQQKQVLKEKYDHQVNDARKHLETEYQQKLEEEVQKAEQRLEQQHKSELAFIEDELRTRLTRQYEEDQHRLQETLKREREKLAGDEQRAVRDREDQMKEQFNQKLLEALRKAETVFQEQSLTQQKAEEEKLRKQFSDEFNERLAAEREAMRQQYASMKTSLEDSFRQEQKKLQAQNEEELDHRLQELREHEAAELEEKRVALRTEVEAEMRSAYEARLSAERASLQNQVEQVLESERQRLRAEAEAFTKSQQENIQKVRTELRSEMEKTFLKRLEQIADEFDHKMELLGAKVPKEKEARVKLYRDRVYSCYGSGEPSIDDARILMELKELLEMTFDEHLAIETDVRLDLYVKNVEQKILSHEIEASSTDALERLKQQFHISSEEATRLEPYILSSFQRLATKGRILVVDDDNLLLMSLKDILADAGFQAITADSVEGGLEHLRTTSVDLILSDIKFTDAELDGFKFFKAVQEEPHLRTLPFIFMSALQEGVIVRSGVQLGVDDYLIKPLDPDLLIAVIEGKLRRYRNRGRG